MRTSTAPTSVGGSRVQVVPGAPPHDEPTWGVVGAMFDTLTSVTSTLVVFAYRAPLLTTLAVWVAADVIAWWRHAWLPAVLLLVLPLLALGLVSWRRPGTWTALRSRVVGEWFRAVVYRPRWTTACLAAGLTQHVGRDAFLPVLVRHRRVGPVDRMLVRLAPGQTLEDVVRACASLASTFTAHSVRARPATRPGRVILDVLRRDPLAGESTAPDPARCPTEGVIVLGRDEHGRDLTFDPYATAHAAVQGSTRSGKSSTCYTLLAALAYRPDVVVTGVDPTGLLLTPFTEGRGAPFIATGNSPDDLDHAENTLKRLVEFADERVQELRARRRDKITDFTPTQPAVWVVLEEWPSLLTSAKALDAARGAKPGQRIAPAIENHVGRLIKEGAKAGVFVLVLAQRMSSEAIRTDDRMNLTWRLTHRVDNSDAVGMLHEGLDRDQTATVRGFAPGVALTESPGHDPRRVRMHYTNYDRYYSRTTRGLAGQAPAPALGADLLGEVITLTTTSDAGDAPGDTTTTTVVTTTGSTTNGSSTTGVEGDAA